MAPEAVPEIRLKPLDKLQMIYRGIQRKRVAERQRCNQKSDYGNNALYIRGTSRDQMLSVVLEELKAVKEDHFCKR